LTPPSWSDSIFLGDTDFQADAGRAKEDLTIFHSFSNYQSCFRTHFNSIWGARAEFGDGAINPSTQGAATLSFGKAAKISTAVLRLEAVPWTRLCRECKKRKHSAA
jgi:hypothetical protein